MHWYNLTAASDRSNIESLETWFWDHGAVSVTVEDGQDNPIFEPPPGEQPLWEEILVTGLFESDTEVQQLREDLGSAGYSFKDLQKVEDRPWEREWLNQFKPMKFGNRLWVVPTGFDQPEPEGVFIHLDPGLAFGTGTHETTHLCLEYLDGLDLEDKRVIDYGCGSGILGIGALLLGAQEVLGVDNDPQALVASNDNAERNGVTMQTAMPGGELVPADIVLANILAQPLIDLADILLAATRDGGVLILSGIMASQADWVINAYKDRATLIDKTILNDWVRLVWQT